MISLLHLGEPFAEIRHLWHWFSTRNFKKVRKQNNFLFILSESTNIYLSFAILHILKFPIWKFPFHGPFAWNCPFVYSECWISLKLVEFPSAISLGWQGLKWNVLLFVAVWANWRRPLQCDVAYLKTSRWCWSQEVRAWILRLVSAATVPAQWVHPSPVQHKCHMVDAVYHV